MTALIIRQSYNTGKFAMVTSFPLIFKTKLISNVILEITFTLLVF